MTLWAIKGLLIAIFIIFDASKVDYPLAVVYIFRLQLICAHSEQDLLTMGQAFLRDEKSNLFSVGVTLAARFFLLSLLLS